LNPLKARSANTNWRPASALSWPVSEASRSNHGPPVRNPPRKELSKKSGIIRRGPAISSGLPALARSVPGGNGGCLLYARFTSNCRSRCSGFQECQSRSKTGPSSSAPAPGTLDYLRLPVTGPELSSALSIDAGSLSAGALFTRSDSPVTQTSPATRWSQSPRGSVQTYWKANRDATDRKRSRLRPAPAPSRHWSRLPSSVQRQISPAGSPTR